MSIATAPPRLSYDPSSFPPVLEALRSIVGDSPGGLAEKELAAIEKKLGVRLPPELRALHAVVGKDPRILRSTRGTLRILEASELTVEDGALLVMKGRSEKWAVKVSVAEAPPVVRSPTPGEAPVGPGCYLERVNEGPWRTLGGGHGAIRLRELATWNAISSMPNVFKGRIRLMSREAKRRIAEALELVGGERGSHRTYVDRALRVVVRYDHLMDDVMVGAVDAGAREELDRRLATQLVALVIDGRDVGKAQARKGAAKAASTPTMPPEKVFRGALLAILRARYGRAAKARSTPWRAKVEKRIGQKLPAPLVEFHSLIGADTAFLRKSRLIVPPSELALEGGYLALAAENQGPIHWALKEGELRLADPPVWQRPRGKGQATRAAASLSAFLVQTACWQAVMGMEVVTQAELEPGSVGGALDAIRQRVPSLAGGALDLPSQGALVDVEGAVLASVLHEGDGATVYFGAAEEAMKSLEKDLALPLEWL